MRVRVLRVGIHKTSSVMALVYGALFVLMLPCFFILDVTEEEPLPLWAFLVMIPFYVLLVYVVTAIGCALYNWISRATGGVELDLGQAGVEGTGPPGGVEPVETRDDDLW